jgi:hypothetical protein
LSISFLIINGCQTFPDKTIIKNRKEYCTTQGLFKNKWWQFYERAQSCAAGQFWSEAENDFRDAIKRFNMDKKDARTYGMRYVDRGYFPHRELGIVLLKQGQLKNAIHELERSIHDEPSSRAKEYLDIAIKAFLEKTSQDRQKPCIQIDAPENNIWTNELFTIIRGRAFDNTYVQHVNINGKSFYIDHAQQEISFWKKMPLSAGKNTITIMATDIMGYTALSTITINSDRTGPIISMDHSSLYVFDQAGIAEVIMGDKRMQINGRNEISMPLANNVLPVIAIDISGNITKSKAAINYHACVVASAADFRHLCRPSHTQINISKPDYMNDDTRIYPVYLDDIHIEGNICGYPVHQLFCNSQTIAIKGKTKTWFSFIQNLNNGRNGLIIRAFDNHGLRSEKHIKIDKRTLDVNKIDYRMKLSFQQNNISPFVRKLINPFIKIIHTRQRFRYTHDMKLADSLLTFFIDKEEGRYLGISVSMTDLSTQEPLANADDYAPVTEFAPVTLQEINHMLTKIHIVLENELPLYVGKIIDIMDPPQITIDMGKLAGLMKNMMVVVFNKEQNNVLGCARIMAPDNFTSRANIIENYHEIQRGDHVITK